MIGPLKTTVRVTTRKMDFITPGEGEMTVVWKATKYFTGIQVQYAADESFPLIESQNFKVEFELDENGNPVSPVVNRAVIKDLVSGTTYYARVRSYIVFEGMNYYGEWSDAMSCTVE